MEKTLHELCPVSNSEEALVVKYIASSSLDSATVYYKNKFVRCSGCTSENCPVFDNAPDNI
ncbi:MAG: hypothetical protein HFJ20_00750 [Clostridia bacterium]|nr:hypothetical protein [Clostridia bacterium]